MTEEAERLHTGALVFPGGNLAKAYQDVLDGGFDFVVLDLSPESDQGYSDRDLTASAWRTYVVGRVGHADEAGMTRQLGWARHLGVPVVMASPPTGSIPIYGRTLHAHLLEQGPQSPVWVPLSWTKGSWPTWHAIRTLCDYDPRLALNLEITAEVPSDDMVETWLAEPVDCVTVDARWLLGASDVSRSVLGRFFSALTRTALIVGSRDASHLAEAKKALEGLFQSSWEALSQTGQTTARYAGQLITAAQPLRDHLDSQTYEHFELGTEKYTTYLHAIRSALAALAKDNANVVVAGAGRGPLVEATLSAADQLGKRVHLTALEKNPNAAVTLRQRLRSEWGARVRFHETDMRSFRPDAPIDLLISELLGGFGDNELSPECLEPIEMHLASGAIVLPSQYRSFIAPLFAPNLFSASCREGTNRERPVVSTLGRSRLLAPPLPCFEFYHPRPDRDVRPLDSERVQTLEFESRTRGVLHGFAGFFESTLFSNHRISILPGDEVAGTSWAPLYFPLDHSILVERGERIEVTFFRRATRTHVWYEWALTRPTTTRMHNPHGRTESMAR